jgi:hydrogenase/urease accessory protein HupE
MSDSPPRSVLTLTERRFPVPNYILFIVWLLGVVLAVHGSCYITITYKLMGIWAFLNGFMWGYTLPTMFVPIVECVSLKGKENE